MKMYQFTRKAIYSEFGIVTAKDEEEARKKIMDGDYDDIIDANLEEVDNDTIDFVNVEKLEEDE